MVYGRDATIPRCVDAIGCEYQWPVNLTSATTVSMTTEVDYAGVYRSRRFGPGDTGRAMFTVSVRSTEFVLAVSDLGQ